MKALILAGGSGTRLWPLSRKNYPKQFLKLHSDKSFLQQTVERLLQVLKPEDIFVQTNGDYKFHVMSELQGMKLPTSNSNIIFEPACKNTAPAIALGLRYFVDKLGCSEDETIFVCPSDHIIKPADRFAEYVKTAEHIAKQGYIVTFGIEPDRPETGYGYIRVKSHGSRVNGRNFYFVDTFVEKPDLETAKKYISEGNYFWNSGMFAFNIGVMLDEFSRYAPKISMMLDTGFDAMLTSFVEMPETSIDYAIMEKSSNTALLPLELYWNDIGSWDSIYDALAIDKIGDKNGNVAIGSTIQINTKNTLIIGNKRLISTIGLDDTLIVETDDAILIAKKGQSQKVKDVVDIIRKDKRIEADEHVTTYRPWGSYTVLEEGQRYKIKRIVVNPQEKLSLQMHHHRSEHWIVVKGTAKVTIADKELFIHENESAYVPKSTLHRLENPGKVPLEIIEVQNGEYLGEDDIERFNDIYGR